MLLLQVMRGGRREKVSIYDIVVGDIVPLKIGDQVHIFTLSTQLLNPVSPETNT